MIAAFSNTIFYNPYLLALNYRRKLGGLVFFLTVSLLASVCAKADFLPLETLNQFEPKISAPTSPSESFPVTLSIDLKDRRVIQDSSGYSPYVSGYPARYTDMPTITWDFGDGTSPVTVKNEMSVEHHFAEQGTYTITAKISDRNGDYASASHQLTVKNRAPSSERLGVVLGEKSGEMHFSAWARDVEKDPLTYVWDFGDGVSKEGLGMWQVSHQYVTAGSYQVSLRIVDGDGEEVEVTETVIFDDGGSSNVQMLDDSTEDPIKALDGFNVAVSGDFTFSSDPDRPAEIGSVGGVHLTSINSGACRFMFTVWDEVNMAHGLFLLDFPGLPKEGGKFRFNNPRVTWVMEPHQGALDLQRGTHGGDIGALRSALSGGTQTNTGNVSPFAIENSVGYGSVAGSAEIDFVPYKHIKGRYQSTLESKDEDWSMINLSGEFAIDLTNNMDAINLPEESRKNVTPLIDDLIPPGLLNGKGSLNYDSCRELVPLQIKTTSPEDGQIHQRVGQPIRVRFDQKIQPDSVNPSTFQIGYRDQSGVFKSIAGQIVKDESVVWFGPDLPLRGGVKYEIRVKSGEQGVKALSGAIIESDTAEESWQTFEFTTEIDFETKSNGTNLLSCNIYQTVRDAPLIVGKKAFAQVSADWPYISDVAESSQVASFDARVTLLRPDGSEIVGEWSRFNRPLRTQPKSSNSAASAWLEIPQIEDWANVENLRAYLQTKEDTDAKLRNSYLTRCPIEIWSSEPSLTVDVFALRVLEWEDYDAFQDVVPTLHRLANEVEEYAWQTLPLKDIKVSNSIQPIVPSVFDVKENEGLDENVEEVLENIWALIHERLHHSEDDQKSNKVNEYILNHAIAEMQKKSSADILLLLIPHGLVTSGGMKLKLEEGQAVVTMFASDNASFFPRYVNGIVHEFGHALDLEHIPYVLNRSDRAKVIEAMSDRVRGVRGGWFQGIDGLRMKRSTSQYAIKSSIYGNSESESLVPLLFPRTVDTDIAFTSHYQYRRMQNYLEKLGR